MLLQFGIYFNCSAAQLMWNKVTGWPTRSPTKGDLTARGGKSVLKVFEVSLKYKPPAVVLKGCIRASVQAWKHGRAEDNLISQAMQRTYFYKSCKNNISKVTWDILVSDIHSASAKKICLLHRSLASQSGSQGTSWKSVHFALSLTRSLLPPFHFPLPF